MRKRRKLKDDIFRLKAEGKSNNAIERTLKCSSSSIAYYFSKGAKNRVINSNKKRFQKHSFLLKIMTFKAGKYNLNSWGTKDNQLYSKYMYDKLWFFKKRGKNMNEDFTLEDVINKVGKNPICYLTGLPIDITKPRTFQFDHIIPTSRGGTNSLENLGICTRTANLMKCDMTLDELENMSRLFLERRGFKVEKITTSEVPPPE